MNEFFELEQKCKKLKIKKIIKLSSYIFASILIIILAIFSYQYFTKKTKSQKNIIQHKISQTKSLPKLQKITQIKKIEKIEKIKPQPKPKKIEKNNQPTPILDLQIDLNKINEPKIINKKVLKPNIKTNKSKPKPTQTIKQSKPKKLLQDETISFDKAMRLATLYYNNADYTNSMKWCKFASNIDNSDEKVWKLYALNLEKTGQKERAIKVLKTYLKYRNSLDLKYLLQRLEK